MRPRVSVAAIIVATFVIWMGSRATAIALPLVALDQTGKDWTTGLVLGAQSVPLVTAGWWSARLRERITTGRAVAAVMLCKTLGLAIVPISAAMHHVGVVALVVCGLVVGATSALDAPGVRSLLSDLGDVLGPGNAARALTLQDLAHRCTMFLAPPLGALAVGRGHTMALLWSECAAVASSAVLMACLPPPMAHPPLTPGRSGDPGVDVHGPLPAAPEQPTSDTPRSTHQTSIATLLHAQPRLAASMAVSAVVALTWFAFSLGLAIAGARSHRPGELIAAGMTGYGLTSTVAAFAAPILVNRIRPWPTAVLPTAVLGIVFVSLPAQLDSLTAITLLAAIGGATMPLGIGAHNRILATDPPPGAQRRTAFAADQIIDGSASSIGMLLGGAVIGLAGISPTLIAAGCLQIFTVVAALAWQRHPADRK